MCLWQRRVLLFFLLFTLCSYYSYFHRKTRNAQQAFGKHYIVAALDQIGTHILTNNTPHMLYSTHFRPNRPPIAHRPFGCTPSIHIYIYIYIPRSEVIRDDIYDRDLLFRVRHTFQAARSNHIRKPQER